MIIMTILIVFLSLWGLGYVIICIKERRLLDPVLLGPQWRRSPPGGFLYEIGVWGSVLTFLVSITYSLTQLGNRWIPGYNHWFPAIVLTLSLFIPLCYIDHKLGEKMNEEIQKHVKEKEERSKSKTDHPN